jgi:hypothetical protein
MKEHKEKQGEEQKGKEPSVDLRYEKLVWCAQVIPGGRAVTNRFQRSNR